MVKQTISTSIKPMKDRKKNTTYSVIKKEIFLTKELLKFRRQRVEIIIMNCTFKYFIGVIGYVIKVLKVGLYHQHRLNWKT